MKTLLATIALLLSTTAQAQLQLIEVSEVPRVIGGMMQPLYSCGCSVNNPQQPHYTESLPGVTSWDVAATRCHDMEGKALPIGANRRRGTGATAVYATLACEPKAMSKESMLEMATAPVNTPMPALVEIEKMIDDKLFWLRADMNSRGQPSTPSNYPPPSSPTEPYYDPHPNDGVPMPVPKKTNPGLTR